MYKVGDILKLYVKDDDGKEIELREVETLNKDSNIIFLMLNVRLRQESLEQYETYMTNKVGKKCIILNSDITKVLSM